MKNYALPIIATVTILCLVFFDLFIAPLISYDKDYVKGYFYIALCLPIIYWTYVGYKAWTSKPFDNKNESEKFNEKIDFSAIPPAPGKTPPKPVDLSGNYILHAQETLEEDLKNIGLKKKPEKESE